MASTKAAVDESCTSAAAKARLDALQASKEQLVALVADLGYDLTEKDGTPSVRYMCVELRSTRGRCHLARCETPLHIDYGEPMKSAELAEQSAAYAALLYVIRERQFCDALQPTYDPTTPRDVAKASASSPRRVMRSAVEAASEKAVSAAEVARRVEAVLEAHTPRTQRRLRDRLQRSVSSSGFVETTREY